MLIEVTDMRASGGDARIVLDGRDVTEFVSDIKLTSGAGRIPTATITFIADLNVKVEGKAIEAKNEAD